MRRFGNVRSYRAGETLVEVGNVGPGLTIILTGRVDITQCLSEKNLNRVSHW